eukprot:COSAG02_NODE_7497_length_2985_cov_1.417533_4_plen_85_part_01
MATPDGGVPAGGLPSPFDDTVAMALQAMATGAERGVAEAPSEGVPPAGSARVVADMSKAGRDDPRWIPKREASCCMLCQKDFSKL